MPKHKQWLSDARKEIRLVKFILQEDFLESAIYHTQQSAEKSLKAFLIFHKQPIIKTHNLKLLAELCIELDPALNLLIDAAIHLNPYSTKFRYPDDIVPPEKDEVTEALELSERIFKFINDKIKDLERGQTRIKGL